MKPGRELDALVAEKVMGWIRLTFAEAFPGKRSENTLTPWWHSKNGEIMPAMAEASGHDDHEQAWSPSTDIASAWLVVEKMNLDKRIHDEFTIMFDRQKKKWRAGSLWWRGYEEADWWEPHTALADSAPLAICLAAFKAVSAPPLPHP